MGAFLLGLSFGAITIGRGAPILLIVLTYIAMYQTAARGFFTILVYESRPLHPAYWHQLVRRDSREKCQGQGKNERGTL